MADGSDPYAETPEALIVALARTGDRDAFAELVDRRQSWIRNLMRRCCGDEALADDLAQQVFLQAWRDIRRLHRPNRFGGWLKRLAINVWLQHARKRDALQNADDDSGLEAARRDTAGLEMDLDAALATLAPAERLCVVLAYHEGMTHEEIAESAELPLGTVKSHIRRGTQRLRERLAAYGSASAAETV